MKQKIPFAGYFQLYPVKLTGGKIYTPPSDWLPFLVSMETINLLIIKFSDEYDKHDSFFY
jgi:hypothetical protein